MKPLISIIVPVYNVEKYVEESIVSLINQTYENIEILICDDGSTDSSGKICDDLKNRDSRITVFHKENGGQGSARNMCLNYAKGDYICFLDSDDKAKKNYIDLLFSMLNEKKLDISVCNFELYSEKENCFLKKRNNGNGYVEFDKISSIESLWNQGLVNIGPWAKLYKRELWENIRFKECFSEDFATMHYVFAKANKIGYTYECGMEYLVRNNSAIHSFQEKKLCMIDICKDIQNFSKGNKILENAARNKSNSVYFHLLFQLPNEKKYLESKKELISLIKKNRLKSFFDKKSSSKLKKAILISFFGFKITKIIFNFMKKKGKTI